MSPSETMPTRRSFSTTGSRRIWRSLMIFVASRVDMSGVAHTRSPVAISRTGLFAWLPSATARITMSRSVITPTGRPFSTIGTTPVSSSFMMRAAIWIVSFGETQRGFVAITSRTFIVVLLGCGILRPRRAKLVLLQSAHPESAILRRPVAKPRLPQVVGLAYHRPFRRADHLPRPAPHRCARPARLGLRGRRPDRPRGAPVSPVRPIRGRPRRSREKTSGHHRVRPRPRARAPRRAGVRVAGGAHDGAPLRRGIPHRAPHGDRLAGLPGVHDRARRAREPRRGEREDRRGGFGRPAHRARPRRGAHPVAHRPLRD